MPRSSSRSSSPARAPARAAPAPSRAAPPAVASAPASAVGPARAGGGGLMGTIMEGMAFGTGSAIAHRAVGAVMGSMSGSSSQQAAPAAAAVSAAPVSGKDRCSPYQVEFATCVQANTSNIASCQMYADQLESCRANM